MKRRTFPPNSREERDTNTWAAKQAILVDDRYFQVTMIFKGYLINVTNLTSYRAACPRSSQRFHIEGFMQGF